MFKYDKAGWWVDTYCIFLYVWNIAQGKKEQDRHSLVFCVMALTFSLTVLLTSTHSR